MKAFKTVAEAKSELLKVNGGIAGDTVWLAKAQPLVLEFLEKISKQKPSTIIKMPSKQNRDGKERIICVCCQDGADVIINNESALCLNHSIIYQKILDHEDKHINIHPCGYHEPNQR